MDHEENEARQRAASASRRRELEAARRRVREGETPWDEERGVMSVVDAVRDLEFPKRRDEMRDAVGDREVWTSGDGKLPLADVLSKVPEDDFLSLGDFQSAVQKHWQGIEFLETPEEQRPK